VSIGLLPAMLWGAGNRHVTVSSVLRNAAQRLPNVVRIDAVRACAWSPRPSSNPYPLSQPKPYRSPSLSDSSVRLAFGFVTVN
jgi:hypothetical protein